MAWWGKLLGGTFGFMLGGPLGAILGAALGHSFDKGIARREMLSPGEQERVQAAFFTATFSVLGHVAKADGRVSEQEIGLARTVMDEMDLSQEKRGIAIRLFTEGKSSDFPLDDVLEQFRRECHRRQTLIQLFLEIQIQGAYADGRMDPAEQSLLLHISSVLGIPEFIFRQLDRMIRAEREFAGGAGGKRPGTKPYRPALDNAYDMLNLDRSASDADVKKSYRRLMSQHHPDKLVAKGLPEEMMKLAARKTHEIRQAYETIKESRGMR